VIKKWSNWDIRSRSRTKKSDCDADSQCCWEPDSTQKPPTTYDSYFDAGSDSANLMRRSHLQVLMHLERIICERHTEKCVWILGRRKSLMSISQSKRQRVILLVLSPRVTNRVFLLLWRVRRALNVKSCKRKLIRCFVGPLRSVPCAFYSFSFFHKIFPEMNRYQRPEMQRLLHVARKHGKVKLLSEHQLGWSVLISLSHVQAHVMWSAFVESLVIVQDYVMQFDGWCNVPGCMLSQNSSSYDAISGEVMITLWCQRSRQIVYQLTVPNRLYCMCHWHSDCSCNHHCCCACRVYYWNLFPPVLIRLM